MRDEKEVCIESSKSFTKKAFSFIGILFFFYLFIVSISLIKDSSVDLWGEFIRDISKNINFVNAFGIGWLFALVLQSSGAAISSLLALNAQGIINPSLIPYMVFGTRIGASMIFFLAIFMIKSLKRRDFRHTFEIGLANIIYALPIAILLFFVEYFFSPFFKLSQLQIPGTLQESFSFVGLLTSPILHLAEFIPKSISLLLGFIFLVSSLNFLSKLIFNFWGEEKIKKIMNKVFKNERNSFALGFFITLILMSTGITITLIIPFIAKRVINLKKALPYMIGANLGSITDVILGGLVVGASSIPGVLACAIFSLIGLIWLFNISLMFNLTKYISKRVIHVSKKRVLYFILFFVLVALALCFV
ncbi:MAG TPA: hypothetical protein PLK34_01325 [Candidatus Pacearchaeota archaeon]|nr:hypothetical protein [Candidatus Pacearchaeota archaeon]